MPVEELSTASEADIDHSSARAGNDITKRLETMGVRVDVGHRAENVVGADGLSVEAFCGAISVIEGAAASAGGADASRAADSTAAARAARGMCSSHRRATCPWQCLVRGS